MEKLRSLVVLGCLVTSAFALGCVARAHAGERQPRMEAALRHLEEAKSELAAAD